MQRKISQGTPNWSTILNGPVNQVDTVKANKRIAPRIVRYGNPYILTGNLRPPDFSHRFLKNKWEMNTMNQVKMAPNIDIPIMNAYEVSGSRTFTPAARNMPKVDMRRAITGTPLLLTF